MTGKDIEIAIEVLNVHLLVWNGLATVDKHRHPPFMGEPNDVVNGRDRPDRIRDLRHRHETRTRIQKLRIRVHPKLSGIVHRHDPKHDTGHIS